MNMKLIEQIVADHQPEQFISVNADLVTLMTIFGLSPAEADVLCVLLREYKACATDFRGRATRIHIRKVRQKLQPYCGANSILSLGMGYYLIPDPMKTTIKNWIDHP